MALEPWGSRGFAHTDLDVQRKQHGLHQRIVMGLMAHTCVEATVRYAAELGDEVTVGKDVTASDSDAEMHAALAINIPHYARAMVTTNEVVAALAAVHTCGSRAPEVDVRGVQGGVCPLRHVRSRACW